MNPPPVIVAIPARNEAAHIEACLAALAAQPGASRRIAGCVVNANNCTDSTAAIAQGLDLPFPLRVSSTILPAGRSHIGYARRGATEAATALMREFGLGDAIIAGTDADSTVGRGWLAAINAAFAADVDAVCGAIDPGGAIPAGLAAVLLAEGAYADACARVADVLDPLPHDPYPNHIWCWGANLAVRATTLVAVGGSPIVDLAEDRALHAILLKGGAKVRHSQAARVTTSARTAGRAPGGFADMMARYADDPAALADYFLEPAAITLARARQRAAARRRWDDRPGFEAHWADHEATDPALARQRIAIVDLGAATARLNAWLGGAASRSDTRASAAAAPALHRASAQR